MDFDDCLHGVALRVSAREVDRPPRRDIRGLYAVSCRTPPRKGQRKAMLLMRAEPKIDRFIRRFENGDGRGIDGIFAVDERDGHALRLFQDKRKGVRPVHVAYCAPQSWNRGGLEIGDMPGQRATGAFGTDPEQCR